MDNEVNTFVFTFQFRQSGVVITETEEKDCTDWKEAYAYFATRCKLYEERKKNLESSSFGRKDQPETACRFSGISLRGTC